MFIVIYLDQFLREESHASGLAGYAVCIPCLVLFGPQDFLIPSMLGILLVLIALRPALERGRLFS